MNWLLAAAEAAAPSPLAGITTTQWVIGGLVALGVFLWYRQQPATKPAPAPAPEPVMEAVRPVAPPPLTAAAQAEMERRKRADEAHAVAVQQAAAAREQEMKDRAAANEILRAMIEPKP